MKILRNKLYQQGGGQGVNPIQQYGDASEFFKKLDSDLSSSGIFDKFLKPAPSGNLAQNALNRVNAVKNVAPAAALSGLFSLMEASKLSAMQKPLFKNQTRKTASWMGQEGGDQQMPEDQLQGQDQMQQQQQQPEEPQLDINDSFSILKQYAEDRGFTNSDGSINKNNMRELLLLLETDVEADFEREKLMEILPVFVEEKNPEEALRNYWNRGVIPMNRRQDVLQYGNPEVQFLQEGRNFKAPKDEAYRQKMGYKDNSPYKDLPQQTFDTDTITMDGVSQPLMAVANNGQSIMMQPGNEYYFPGATQVTEYPINKMRMGGLLLKSQEGNPQFGNSSDSPLDDWEKDIMERATRYDSYYGNLVDPTASSGGNTNIPKTKSEENITVKNFKEKESLDWMKKYVNSQDVRMRLINQMKAQYPNKNISEISKMVTDRINQYNARLSNADIRNKTQEDDPTSEGATFFGWEGSPYIDMYTQNRGDYGSTLVHELRHLIDSPDTSRFTIPEDEIYNVQKDLLPGGEFFNRKPQQATKIIQAQSKQNFTKVPYFMRSFEKTARLTELRKRAEELGLHKGGANLSPEKFSEVINSLLDDKISRSNIFELINGGEMSPDEIYRLWNETVDVGGSGRDFQGDEIMTVQNGGAMYPYALKQIGGLLLKSQEGINPLMLGVNVIDQTNEFGPTNKLGPLATGYVAPDYKTNDPYSDEYVDFLNKMGERLNADPFAIAQMLEKVAYHESAKSNNPAIKQNLPRGVNFNPNKHGVGLFQYDKPSVKTSVQRWKNLNSEVPQWLRDFEDSGYNVDTLTGDQQRMLALIDMTAKSNFNVMNALKDNRSLSREWGRGWQTKSDRRKMRKFLEDVADWEENKASSLESLKNRLKNRKITPVLSQEGSYFDKTTKEKLGDFRTRRDKQRLPKSSDKEAYAKTYERKRVPSPMTDQSIDELNRLSLGTFRTGDLYENTYNRPNLTKDKFVGKKKSEDIISYIKYLESDTYLNRLKNYMPDKEARILRDDRVKNVKNASITFNEDPYADYYGYEMSHHNIPYTAYSEVEIADPNTGSTLTHEISHASLRDHSKADDMTTRQIVAEKNSDWSGLEGITLTDAEKKQIQNSIKSKNKTPEYIADNYKYYSNPNEYHSRLDSVRRLAYDLGIHKKFGENFTKDQLLKIKKLTQSNSKIARRYSDILDILRLSKDTNSLLKNLNTIAFEQPAQSQDEIGNEIMAAQQGGFMRLPKMQDNGSVSDDELYQMGVLGPEATVTASRITPKPEPETIEEPFAFTDEQLELEFSPMADSLRKMADILDPSRNKILQAYEILNRKKEADRMALALSRAVQIPGSTPSVYSVEDVAQKEQPQVMREGGIPARYKNMGFTKVGQKKQSNRPGKKWMVLAKKGTKYKVVHGGAAGMSDFTKHNNEKRRDRFWDRMGGKDSAKANDKFSPLYWHKRFGTW